jgi:CRP/FNR family transcriptional regulator, anaerobic regulatory protein
MNTPTCSGCGLGEVTIYRNVLKKNPELVAACRSEVQRYSPNRVVIRQDQVPRAFYTVYKGWLYRYRKLANGRQQIISFVIPGDVIPFFSIFKQDTALFYGIKSITNVELCAFDCKRFRHLIAADQAFTGPFQMAVGQYLESLHRRIADIGQRSAKGRLAQLLIELFERHEKRAMTVENSFEFPVSQELLARALGLTKAYVNRMLAALKAGGTIEQQGRRLTIIDLNELKRIAEDF